MLQLFPLSLTGAAFTWYSSLPPNYVQNWVDMKCLFYDRFYKPQPETSILDLLGIKQQDNEPITEFLERFRKVKRKCSVQLPEAKCASIAVNNIYPQLREKLLFHNIVIWPNFIEKSLK